MGNASKVGMAVTEWILKGIQNGELVPGQRLVERDLCETLNASHTEVGTALTNLSLDKVLEQVPNRGARVRAMSLQEALQTAEVRMVVECLCAARAAERIADDQIEELRVFGREMEALAAEENIFGYSELVNRLISAVVRIANRPVAEELLKLLRNRTIGSRFGLRFRADRAKVSLPHWLALINAICERNPDEARKAVERRVESVYDAISSLAETENRVFSKRLF